MRPERVRKRAAVIGVLRGWDCVTPGNWPPLRPTPPRFLKNNSAAFFAVSTPTASAHAFRRRAGGVSSSGRQIWFFLMGGAGFWRGAGWGVHVRPPTRLPVRLGGSPVSEEHGTAGDGTVNWI